jgi:hypothetical protein
MMIRGHLRAEILCTVHRSGLSNARVLQHHTTLVLHIHHNCQKKLTYSHDDRLSVLCIEAELSNGTSTCCVAIHICLNVLRALSLLVKRATRLLHKKNLL